VAFSKLVITMIAVVVVGGMRSVDTQIKVKLLVMFYRTIAKAYFTLI
jgi:hypothetical protein